MFDFTCYLCGSKNYRQRQGHTRDNANLVPLECMDCGLVQLSSFDHISPSFYEDSHMHDNAPVTPELMLQRSQEDTERRLAQFREELHGRKLLDVGCGAGGFLLAARSYAQSVCGVEPEKLLAPFFARQGLNVYPSLDAIPPNKSFDIITLFHVLEHSPNPVDLLASLRILAGERERERERVSLYHRSSKRQRCSFNTL